MKTIKMQGGLGNQLFCLAFARGVARLSGEPVALDMASFATGHYGYRFELGPLAQAMGMTETRRPWLSARLTTAVMRRLPGLAYVSDTAPPADLAALTALARRGVYFNGYWQDEAWIADGEGFRERARAFLLEKGGDTPERGVVIHCRTYNEEVRPERRRVPDAAWFERCLERLRALGHDTGDIALVSDNTPLALSRLGPLASRIDAPASSGPWADMALLLRARALILTNSTFSWWGGYCGEAKAALYPARGALFHYARPAARFTVVD